MIFIIHGIEHDLTESSEVNHFRKNKPMYYWSLIWGGEQTKTQTKTDKGLTMF